MQKNFDLSTSQFSEEHRMELTSKGTELVVWRDQWRSPNRCNVIHLSTKQSKLHYLFHMYASVSTPSSVDDGVYSVIDSIQYICPPHSPTYTMYSTCMPLCVLNEVQLTEYARRVYYTESTRLHRVYQTTPCIPHIFLIVVHHIVHRVVRVFY